jgi:hypothetical protein
LDLLWERDAVEHGAGNAVKSIVLSILIRRPEKNYRLRKIIMMRTAVVRKKDLSKRITALEDIQDTVSDVGNV